MDDLRKQLERQMLIEQVQRQEVGSKLNITEEEARQYYARHPEEFTESASIMLREIFIEVPSSEAGINVEMINTSEVRVNVVVDGLSGDRGLKELQKAFADVLR